MSEHTQITISYNRAFAWGAGLNIGFVLVEAIFGLLAGSLALLSDAGHNAGDVIGLLLAWGANRLAQRPPNQRHTYGWRSSTILAAMLNGFILLIAVGVLAREAIARLANPEPIASDTIIWVAAVGTAINLMTAMLFFSGRKQDLNIRGAFTHMAADAGVSAAVVAAGLTIRGTGWLWLDPALSLVIAGVIFWSTWGLLRDTVHLAMGGVPEEIDLPAVESYLENLPGVQTVHDLHIWALSTTETALSAHLVRPESRDQNELLEQAIRELHQKFDIDHPTLQIEQEELACCRHQICGPVRKGSDQHREGEA